jgi:hypothetical protein
MNAAIKDRVREEVESLHRFFEGWFSGALQKSAFEPEFLGRFEPDFVLIPPTGRILTLEEMAASLLTSHGTRPDFRISIHNVKVRSVSGGHILATYEEWQQGGLASAQGQNARITTVVFSNVEPLRWAHVHETSIPVDGAAKS